MKVLSLFDGMACGMLAMQRAGNEVDRYVAYEIDKYAVQTSTHNFPMIEQKGDVFQADFTEYSDFDFLIGGSPCTYWSIAQKNNRETEASGMGWELFSQYVRALHEAKPKFFIYENNKSMSKAIRASIDEAFGFEAICINSALVSAQNRQRLYWVGKRNEDGTYSKVDIEQPEDRGILLKDILDSVVASPVCPDCDKGKTLTASYYKYAASDSFKKANPRMGIAEPVCVKTNIEHLLRPFGSKAKILSVDAPKSNTLLAAMGTGGGNGIYVAEPASQEDGVETEPVRVGTMPQLNGVLKDNQATRIYSIEGKSVTQSAQGGGWGAKTGLYAIPCCNMIVKEATKKGFTEIEPMACVDMTQPNSKTRRGRNMADKSNCCMTSCQHYQYCGVLAYATPCEWDENGNVTKAVSCADGKTYTVYEVKDGKITIKGKQYPIKLVDGFYIIRKLTVKECMRLQTVPEWYEFPVSDSQAYKMLGNGWTVEVIAHLLTGIRNA